MRSEPLAWPSYGEQSAVPGGHELSMRRTLAALIVLTGLAWPSAAAAATTVAKVGDASITHDVAARAWMLGAGGTTLTLALDPASDFQVTGLVTSSNKAWVTTSLPDTVVTVNGGSFAFGSRADGFSYTNVTTSVRGTTLRLDAIFDLTAAGLRVTRHYSVTAGAPVFETWTSFEPLSGAGASVANINAFQLSVPNGTLRYLTGLQGDNADTEHDSAFSLLAKTVAAGEHFTLGAVGRSSEQTVPWLAIDGSPDEFFAALMWSGSWSLTADRTDAGLILSLGLPPMTVAVSAQAVDGPHAIFGVVRGGIAQATSSLRAYIQQALRGGTAITPLVTYNTWFAYGTRLDEASMKDEMARAASLGAELFVMDAGWYLGAGANGVFDFDSGLGTWQADPARFPSGLHALTDYAHSLGLKFGIWVEPERVSLSTVGRAGLADESWLAKSNDVYGSDRAAQICFASAAARQWVLTALTGLIDSVQPDYLKWDNNMWVNCNRSGHGHGPTDGNFAHVNGLYQVFASLRARYPSLLIENVSGGGNRLDLGMLRYSDSGWMDDRTAPSVHVRHNVQGLSAVFPPAYLLSFVTDHAGEPLRDSPDLPLYFRSRMEGALGLSFLSADFSDADTGAIRSEIDIYKAMRATQALSAGALLSRQAAAAGGPSWDVLQETASGGKRAILCAVQTDSGTGKVTVKPTGLAWSASYEVRSVDTGALGTATGADLMSKGIDVLASPRSAAHILTLTAK